MNLEGREDAILPEDKLSLKMMHSNVRYFRYCILIALLMLSLFTKPPWCTNYGDLIDVGRADSGRMHQRTGWHGFLQE